MSFVTPPVVAVFGFGIFGTPANATAANWTLGAGIPLEIIAWISVELQHLMAVQYLYACGMLILLSSASIIIISVAVAPPENGISELVWTPALWHQESDELQGKPWYSNHRTLSVLLAAITMTIVALCW